MNTIALIVAFAAVVVLLIMRMPVVFAFGIVGFFGLCYLQGFNKACTVLYTVPFSSISGYTWSALPLYCLFGYLAYNTRLTEDFFSGVRSWLGHVRGGMLHAIIVGNAAFGACCGVSLAAASSFTAISLPECRKYGYDDHVVLGTIAGSCTLSMLIPPSTGLIMYGCLTTTSISELFIAGVIPGIIQVILFMGVAVFIAVRHPEKVPMSPKATVKERLSGIVKMSYLVIIFGVIIGGLYIGWFTPTEGAGVGAFLILILGVVRRRLTWEGIKASLIATVEMAAVTLLLLAGTQLFNSFLTLAGFSTMLINAVKAIASSGTTFLIIVAIMMIILGMFIDVAPLTILLVPLLYPIATSYGINAIQFGVLFTLLGSVGTISPPFGIVTYSLARMVPEARLMQIFKKSIPYLAMMLVLIVLLIFIPDITLALTSGMKAA
ncbi:MAG: TRAP transporter large permease [Lachnospiraceae bacterium]|nr:TRAP transporter large permease [Lachnospiraceae bacterium]